MRWRHDPDRTRIVRRRCQYGIGAVVATPGTYRALPARLLALARKGPEARHAAPVAVTAHRIEPQVPPRLDRPLRIGAERAGDQLITIVEPSRDPVRLADEGAASAADHAQA